MHCSGFEGTLAPLFQDMANMDFMWACRGGLLICTLEERLEGSCGISHSICSAMCKGDMENPKWCLQHPELLGQRNCRDGSTQFQYPTSDEHQCANPQKLQRESG